MIEKPGAEYSCEGCAAPRVRGIVQGVSYCGTLAYSMPTVRVGTLRGYR